MRPKAAHPMPSAVVTTTIAAAIPEIFVAALGNAGLTPAIAPFPVAAIADVTGAIALKHLGF